MMKVGITTVDNPYDPIDDFDRWYQFDRSKDYRTCERLAILAKSSDEASPLDEFQAVEEAVDRLVELNPIGLYRKVKHE